MSDSVKKVSKKKILFVQLDEEITSVYERISDVPYKEVYLVVPKRAVLLQSIVNLRILKQKLEDIDKEMAIITSDSNGMKLAHQCEIRVFDHWEGSGSEGKAEKKNPEATLLKPIAASSNDVDDDLPSRLPKKKSSIFEVVRHMRTQEDGFSLKRYLRDWKKNRLEHVRLPGGNRKFITGLVVTSLAVFVFIAYVVLPGATIYIEPASDVVTKAVNITLELNPDDPRELKSYSVSADTEYSMSHPATGILSEGSRATGVITIINTSDRTWDLVQETRFQTDEGLVFRIQQDVSVPSGTVENPGSISATVIADELDANGTLIGERGNIAPSRFFLPGLRDDSRELIYAENYEAFAGGETKVSAILLEEDLTAAREKLEAELQERVLSALQKEVLSQGNALNTELSLLEDSDVLQYSSVVVDMPYELVGQEMEDFELEGNISLSGVAYDREALLAILKTEIVTAETPGKQLVRIDEDSVSINVMEFDNSRLSYKFTAQIQGIEEYEIDPELEGGSKLAKRIREHIAGENIEDAEQFIQNLPEVNKVEIKIWPVWSPTIPKLTDNIKIKSLSKADPIE